MTSSNADIVRSAILAQNAGDDDAMLAAMDADVHWEGASPAGGLRGRDALRETLVAARREVGEVRITMHELQEQGDAVLVVGSIATGNGLHMPRAWIWRLRDGLAVHVRSYQGAEEARRDWDASRPAA